MELLTRVTEFEHDPLPEDMPFEAQQALRAVEAEVRLCEEPLFDSLQRHYPHKFPRVCGRASIALAHVLSIRRDVPIINPYPRQQLVERLSLYPSIFNPFNDPEWPPEDEHTWLGYCRSDYSLAIDPTIRLSYGMRPGRGATRIEWYESHLLLHGVRQEMGMVSPVNQVRPSRNIWGRDEPNDLTSFEDLLEIMHSPRVFHPEAQARSRRVYDIADFFGPTLERVVHEVLAALPPSTAPIP